MLDSAPAHGRGNGGSETGPALCQPCQCSSQPDGAAGEPTCLYLWYSISSSMASRCPARREGNSQCRGPPQPGSWSGRGCDPYTLSSWLPHATGLVPAPHQHFLSQTAAWPWHSCHACQRRACEPRAQLQRLGRGGGKVPVVPEPRAAPCHGAGSPRTRSPRKQCCIGRGWRPHAAPPAPAPVHCSLLAPTSLTSLGEPRGDGPAVGVLHGGAVGQTGALLRGEQPAVPVPIEDALAAQLWAGHLVQLVGCSLRTQSNATTAGTGQCWDPRQARHPGACCPSALVPARAPPPDPPRPAPTHVPFSDCRGPEPHAEGLDGGPHCPQPGRSPALTRPGPHRPAQSGTALLAPSCPETVRHVWASPPTRPVIATSPSSRQRCCDRPWCLTRRLVLLNFVLFPLLSPQGRPGQPVTAPGGGGSFGSHVRGCCSSAWTAAHAARGSPRPAAFPHQLPWPGPDRVAGTGQSGWREQGTGPARSAGHRGGSGAQQDHRSAPRRQDSTWRAGPWPDAQ